MSMNHYGNGAMDYGYGDPAAIGMGGGEDIPMVDVLPGLESSPPRPNAGQLQVRPRTLGGDRERDRNRGEGRRIEYIGAPGPEPGPLVHPGALTNGGIHTEGAQLMPLPELKNWLSTSLGTVNDDVVEAVNDPRGGE